MYGHFPIISLQNCPFITLSIPMDPLHKGAHLHNHNIVPHLIVSKVVIERFFFLFSIFQIQIFSPISFNDIIQLFIKCYRFSNNYCLNTSQSNKIPKYLKVSPMCGSRGGDRGSGPPLKNHKIIGFPSNTGPDLLKNHKSTKPAFNVLPSTARQRNAI